MLEVKNSHINKAKKNKNDEFYTLYEDIEKEIENYLLYDECTFRNKVIYCNCDNPYYSNFFKYFSINFNKLGLKSLISSYKNFKKEGDTSQYVVINNVKKELNVDISNNEILSMLKEDSKNIFRTFLSDGDFRSDESIELLKRSDIIVTNPPFSMFREYIKQLIDYNKKFLIISNINAITYKEIFPLIKDNKIWLGTGMGRWISGFVVPESYELYGTEARINEKGHRIVSSNNCLWFTNLNHGKRNEFLSTATMSHNIEFSKYKKVRGIGYKKYDNFDAIEVPYTDAIPSDYDGVMGVPITFLDKYNPEQFEILGCSYEYGRPYGWDDSVNMSVSVEGKNVYKRILIKHKHKNN